VKRIVRSCAASCVCSKFEVAVTIHLDESQDCDVGQCSLSVRYLARKQKRIVYGRRVLKEGMTEGTQRRSVTGRQGQKGATETRKQRGFL
jgi:hypothetical protein